MLRKTLSMCCGFGMGTEMSLIWANRGGEIGNVP